MLALLSAVSRTGVSLSSTGRTLVSPEPARVREPQATAGVRP